MNTEDILKHLNDIKIQIANISTKPKKERIKKEPTAKQLEQREKFKKIMQSLKTIKPEDKQPETIEQPKKTKKKSN
jgi:hypothetical protein